MSVFFTSRKTGFKSWLDISSIPPRHLAVCRASSAFSYRIPDSFLIPGGSIKNGSASSIASWHLVDRSSFCSWFWWVIPRYLLDTSAIDDLFLDTSLNNCLDTSRYLHLSSFIEGLYIHFFAIWFSFLRSLDLSAPVHLPNTISLTPNLFLCDFSSFFKFFLLLVSF